MKKTTSRVFWDGKGVRLSLYRASKGIRHRLYIEGRKRPIDLTGKQYYDLKKAFVYEAAYSMNHLRGMSKIK